MVGVPQSSHGVFIISIVMLTFALCSESTPITFARAARLVSLRSTHSIAWSSIAMVLYVRIPVADIFLFLSVSIEIQP